MKTSSFSLIENALRELLPNRKIHLSRVRSGADEYLILLTKHDVVGFVAIGPRAASAFDSSYANFKLLYRKEQPKWHGKTLSMVLCVPAAHSDQVRLLEALESDVYFCKKYLVRLDKTPLRLRAELMRLPFVPLPEGGPGGVIQPESAQSMLQAIGIEAAFSRQIVVQGEYSAERMVDDIVSSRRDLPTLDRASPPPTYRRSHLPDAVRLKSISIQGFRAYKERRTFDLDASLVVFFGPNGLGKTSLFDAIDYACTGRIGRLGPGRIDSRDFVNLARHLDSNAGFGAVTLDASSASASMRVIRRVNNWNLALLNDQKADRAAVLQSLTSANWPEKSPRIENIARLFRATHLFSQTDPELFSGFMRGSVMTADLVSRMLALDDYASGLSKVDSVGKVVQKKIVSANEVGHQLRKRHADLRDRLQALGYGPKASPTRTAERLANDIMSSLSGIKGIRLPKGPLNASLAHDWRDWFHASADRNEKELIELTELREQLPRIRELEARIPRWANTLGKIAKAVEQSQNVSSLSEIERDKAKSRIARVQQRLAQIKKVRSDLTKARSQLHQIPSMAEQIEGLGKSIEALQLRLPQYSEEMGAIDLELAQANTAIKELEHALALSSHRERDLTSLSSKERQWVADRKRVEEKTRELGELALRKEQLQANAALKNAELLTATEGLGRAEQRYKSLTMDSSELTALLDQIERFVTSNICPLCGVEHQSHEELMHAIESHKERRTSEADESAREYGVLKKTVGDLQQSIDDLARQDSDTEQVIIAKTAEIESLSAVLSAWSHEATQAGFDPEADSLFHAIAAAGSKNQAEKQSLTDAILIEKSKVSVAGDRQKEILQAEKVTREQLSTSLNDFEVISMKKADLERELRLAGTDPGATDKDLKSRIEGQNSLIELQEKAISEEEASYSARQAEVLEHSLSLRGLLAKQQSIEERSREARAKTSRFGSRLERAGLHLQGTIEEIDAKTGELERKRKVLREGETKVRFLEKILDSASRTAEMNDIETELGDIREKQKALRLAISQLKTARRWFGSVRESLQMKRERAVESHILAYGPLASVIQSRLRAVFGFGQIRLESKKDEIHVSVSRGSRYFRPTDYFSESQKQILMLSLFVAGRLTQNWSGFAPILLDDPVTHFDDLNAYCFVELLKGLLQDNASSKQFFISTCEERLFALMRDKLRDLEGGARFYQFKGISSDGPDISILDS